MNQPSSSNNLWMERIIANRGVKRLKASIAKYGSTPGREYVLAQFEEQNRRASEKLSEALRSEWAAHDVTTTLK